jgi:C-5 cytosine-specific DNA methylase
MRKKTLPTLQGAANDKSVLRADPAPYGSSDEKRPVAIDLFCGAGGMSLGMERAGFDIHWQLTTGVFNRHDSVHT